MKKYLLAVSAAIIAVASSSTANAAVAVFAGADDGAPTTGPFPNSAAAAASFTAAASAYGLVTSDGFETAPVGYNASFSLPGVSVALTGQNFGAGFSGVSNTTSGNLYGFNTTSGGANWLGFPNGSATFNFASPTNAFGFYLTGVQSVFTSVLTLTQLDGTSATYNIPINAGGGANYFGIVDTATFTSAQINVNSGGDAWGIDDISFTNSAVPEPATWLMMLMGFAAIGGAMRRQRQNVQVSFG